MRLFIWECIEKCSERYHSRGGLVVFARGLDRARELARGLPGCDPVEPPDYDLAISGQHPERVIQMPDAGCC